MTKDNVNNSQGQNWDLSQDLNTIVNRNGYKVAFVNEINPTKGGTLQECNFQDSGLTYIVDNRIDCAKVINYDMNNIVNIHGINSSNYQSFSLESQVPTADHWGIGNSGDCITVTQGVEHNPTVDPRGQGLNPSMTGHYHTLNHHNTSNVKVYKVDFTNWVFYCPDKNSIDHIVFIHNVGDCQYGGFYYLVQYLQDKSIGFISLTRSLVVSPIVRMGRFRIRFMILTWCVTIIIRTTTLQLSYMTDMAINLYPT